MWINIEKDRKNLSTYSYVLAFLLFLMLLRMDSIKDMLICRVFKVCDTNVYKEKTNSFVLDAQRYTSSSLLETSNRNSLFMNLSSDVFLRDWKKKVLIYSLARSGSSFLGEIFNRRDDVFYIYEPLHTLNVFAKVGMLSPFEYTFKAPDVLQDFLRCKFAKYEDHFKFISFPELCNPHFRLMSKVLSSPPFCRKHINSNSTEDEYRQNCYALVPALMQKLCMGKKHIVIKELVHRLPLQSINGILPLFKDNLFRMVCLVRDPRAVVASMKSIGGIGNREDSFASSVESASGKVCKILTNHYHSLNLPDLVIKSKLIAVRYEDIVSQPEDAIRALFSFVNMEIDQKTVEWVIENTHGQLDNTIDSFSVFLRNVSYSLNSWRRSLTFEQVDMIQSKCGPIMKKFGYVLYSNKHEVLDLRNPAFNSNFGIDNIIRVV